MSKKIISSLVIFLFLLRAEAVNLVDSENRPCARNLERKPSPTCSLAGMLHKLKCGDNYIGLMDQYDASVIFCERKSLTAAEEAIINENIYNLKNKCFPQKAGASRQYLEDREILYKYILVNWERCKKALIENKIERGPLVGSYTQYSDGRIDLQFRSCQKTHNDQTNVINALTKTNEFGFFLENRDINFCQLKANHSTAPASNYRAPPPANRGTAR